MNRIEAVADRLDPRVSVRLRWLKKRWKRDLVLRLSRALVRPGDVVADVGANRGVYTLGLSSAVGRHGRVHSFDPVPVNVRSLHGLRRSHDNIVVHPLALSDATGSADLHVPVVGRARVDALARLGPPPPTAHETSSVEVSTLDHELRDLDRPLAFVKCDVEGHEHHVVRGGRGVIGRDRPALLVEIEQRHRTDDVTSTIGELLDLGYEGYGLAARHLAPIAGFDVERDQLRHLDAHGQLRRPSSGYIGNFLFVRPGTALGSLAVR